MQGVGGIDGSAKSSARTIVSARSSCSTRRSSAGIATFRVAGSSTLPALLLGLEDALSGNPEGEVLPWFHIGGNHDARTGVVGHRFELLRILRLKGHTLRRH